MGFMNEKLWDFLKKKAREEDENVRKERQIENEFLTEVRKICEYGVERAKTIRDTFPMFTLHDETHICNVMQLMADLLGDDAEKLTRDETAMLIMSACCHDIGMSYSEKEKQALFNDIDRLNKYLENNHSEYVKAFSSGNTVPKMTDDMIQNYLRCIHHERVMELLSVYKWPSVLEGKIDRRDLICVCQSHGKDISSLDEMEPTATVDLRFCAILLRLADILDFDTSRAPETVYEYSGFQKAHDSNMLKSKEEWDKHLASQGFDFLHIKERKQMYFLDYSATCRSMQVEQTVNCYLDWVDQELNFCGKQLNRFAGKWQDFILPGKIKRNIKSEGYVSGQYRLSLDQDKILELLIGKDLYSDPSVFVRELIQNAIDAVRTREQLDKNLPSGWKGQINIRCWMDQEGYHWFRIEDNGIGMTEDVIMNFFLKIGSSYYSSDTFLKSKLQCNANVDYMPISRFGIGILSCFMGDDQGNQVEISTKHFKEGETYYPALRLSMHGINGYYYLSNSEKKHTPEPMKGVTEEEKAQYLAQPGTVIAVRTNLYQTGRYSGFKEIVDKYVIYPPVAIHYDGEEGSCDYMTEEDFVNVVDSICPSSDLSKKGLMEFVIPEEELSKIHNEVPEILFENPPRLLLKCISLKDYAGTPFLKGAILTAKAEGHHDSIHLKLGDRKVEATIDVRLNRDNKGDKLGVNIRLRLEDDFTEQMQLLDKNYKQRDKLLSKLGKNFATEFFDDIFKREIVEGLIRNYIDEPDWKEHLRDSYGISDEKLNEAIKEVIESVKGNDRSGMRNGDIEALLAFKALRKQWTFDLCSLSDFKWYNDFFKIIINKTGLNSSVVHNGILCGNANFVFEDKVSHNLGTIILLKDKYRPYLDVARDGVRGLTLETAGEIEIIRRNIIEQGYKIEGDLSDLREENYSDTVMADYCKLLDERDDLAKQLVFDTDKAALSSVSLADELQNTEKIELRSSPTMSNRLLPWGKNDDLYLYIAAAYLRENYLVQVQFASRYSEIFVSKKEKNLSDNYEKLFPAFFFLPAMDNNCSTLTSKINHTRYACNEYHRLSQFILKNGMKLKKTVPGIFRELLRTLAEEEHNKLIDNVNGLLKSLRKFPGGLFEIPEELFISEKDLI